uniref:Uncharacterized protein n=1 Tax=Ascaris lumbricoides TaxID=6252 RepID=A0A0M3IGC9_ASCLU
MSSRGDTSAECSCNVVLGGQRNIKSIGLISSKRTRRAEVTISISVVALGSSGKWLQNKNDENVVNGSITTPISTQMKIRSRRVASVNARIATLLRKILELQVRYNNVF